MLAFFLGSAGGTQAQETGHWEAGVSSGVYLGTRIYLDPATDLQIGDSPSFGLRGAYDIDRSFSLEGSYSHTRGHVTAKDPATGDPLAPSARLDVDSYDLTGLYRFGSGKFRGHAGLGIGAMSLRPFVADIATQDGTRFSVNIALGGKFFLNENLALRADARYRLRNARSRTGAVVCGTLGCYGFTTNLYSSTELTGGVSYRFGGAPLRDRGPPPPAAITDLAAIPESGPAEVGVKRRFVRAAGEIVLLEIFPWAMNRYVFEEDFARISLNSVRKNFRTGFTYDRDKFKTNQGEHPYHGGLFFNAARSNGYDFWESGAFAMAGSFGWESLMENDPPAVNDLVNTTLGGMALGEITRRLAVMIRDNAATGFRRFWRELAGGLVDPMGGFNRLLNGETRRVQPNTNERFPSSFQAVGELGYRHLGGDAAVANQGTFSLGVAYGDPFAGEIERPFDSFSGELDLNVPGSTVSRVEGKGILKGWELTDASAPTRHILAVSQEYEYLSNEAQVFGAQVISIGLLSRRGAPAGFTLTTDMSVLVYPLAGIQTTNVLSPETGRTYDYAPGAGLRVGGRLDRGGFTLAAAYAAAWNTTANGNSDHTTLQFLVVSARVPLSRGLGLRASTSWYSRKTFYTNFFEERRTQSEWRLAASWRL
ncbi:MAG: DUF3943 domain-containing protein [Thermoanaerobaculia bacterium]